MKNQKINLIYFFKIVLVICLIFFFLYFIKSNNIVTNYTKVEAIINEITHDLNENGEVTNKFFVNFTLNDVNYENIKLDNLHKFIGEGENLTIFVDKNNPNNIKTMETLYFEIFILSLFAIIFCIIGVSAIYQKENNKKRVV